MEQIIAIILLLIMITIDYLNLDKFTNFVNLNKKNIINNNQNTNHYATKHYEPLHSQTVDKLNLWIFSIPKVSSREWHSFGSRNTIVNNTNLSNLCLETINNNVDHSKFNINIIYRDDIKRLLPEYECYIKECKSEYVYTNLVKYAILNKYGGVWIPCNTIFLKNFKYDNRLFSNHIVTYGYNNTNYIDNEGYSDTILGASSNNVTIKKMIMYLKSNLHTFQNGMNFKNSINKHFNMILKDANHHLHNDIEAQKHHNGGFLTLDTLFSTNFVNIDRFNSRGLYVIDVENIKNYHKYNYVLRLNKNELLNSNLFLSYLIKQGLN